MTHSFFLGRFFASAIAWFLALTLLWLPVSAWTSYPVAGIAHVVLDYGARDWVRKVDKALGRLNVETRIVIVLPGQSSGRAELIVEVDPSKNAYGLPLFLALLLASRSRHLFRRALAGYVILLVPQAFSVVLDILKQIIVAQASPLSLGIGQWQMEVIALGYQFGALLLPTLAPVILWLFLEQAFLAAVMVDGGLSRAATEYKPLSK